MTLQPRIVRIRYQDRAAADRRLVNNEPSRYVPEADVGHTGYRAGIVAALRYIIAGVGAIAAEDVSAAVAEHLELVEAV